MASFSWDPYDGNYLPNCCTGNCQYIYDPETGEKYPVKCGNGQSGTVPDYPPDPGQCVEDCEPTPVPPSILFQFSAGERPAGSIFSRAGAAFELSDTSPPTSSPRWYTVSNPQGIIFALGDSITLGFSATESYFPKVQRTTAPTKRLHNSNLAVNSAYLSNSGDPATNISDICAAFVDPVFSGMKGVAVVFGGTNDMFLGSADGATAFTRLQAVCGLIRASHSNVKIVVVTPLPRQNNGTFEVERQSMRALMNSGDSSYDFVADWGGNATMAANAASSTNLTYYADQIHPTNAGQIIGASIVGPKVGLALTAAGL